ncbi:MAG: hypothetical protein KBF93_07980 [Leptospiraceae bacterium]|nr:hypothetical protein [Leptospiraceae bacterium]
MKLLIILMILSFQMISAEETEMVKVTLLRKGVQAIVKGETITPKMDDELPLHAKIQSDEKGFLEFEYKGNTYRVNKNTTIVLADVVKSSGEKNYLSNSQTHAGGVRGLGKTSKKDKTKKPKKEKVEDN